MVKELLNRSIWANSLREYLILAVILLAGILLIRIVDRILMRKLKKWSKASKTTIDDFILDVFEKIIVPALYFGVFYMSINTLSLAPWLGGTLEIAGVAVVTVVIARILVALVVYGLRTYLSKRGKDNALERSLKGILVICKFLIWGLAVIFFLDNLGLEITSVIAGLGIGGVAVALAAQAVLGDLFSYFAILFDRPFEIGDFIIIGDFLGTIEHVGIKTTRIRSLGGEQLVFSNTDLTNSRVRNYKRMGKRRVVFKLGVVYQTPLTQLKEIPKIIKGIIGNIEDTVFDRAHFFSYGDFSLIFEVVYYVIGADYNKYMDIQQNVNLAIMEEFKKRGIEFAYPTQTLFLTKEAE